MFYRFTEDFLMPPRHFIRVIDPLAHLALTHLYLDYREFIRFHCGDKHPQPVSVLAHVNPVLLAAMMGN